MLIEYLILPPIGMCLGFLFVYLKYKRKEKEEKAKKELDERFESLEKSTNEKFESLEKSTNEKFESLEKSTNEKSEVLEKSTNEKFESLEKSTNEKFEALEKSTNEKFEALEKSTNEKFEALEKNTHAKLLTIVKGSNKCFSEISNYLNHQSKEVTKIQIFGKMTYIVCKKNFPNLGEQVFDYLSRYEKTYLDLRKENKNKELSDYPLELENMIGAKFLQEEEVIKKAKESEENFNNSKPQSLEDLEIILI
jgi:hypothetical protein